MKRLLKDPFFIVIALFIISCITFTSVGLAKYYSEKEINDNTIESDKFYFTVDLLGDTNDDSSLSKTFNLYGEGEKTFKFKVQNYFDSFRINQDAISYSVSLTSSDESYTPTLTSTNSDFSFTNSKQIQENEFTLSLPADYNNNTKVTVNVSSSFPYEKEMELIFVLHTIDYEVAYYIEDTLNSPYASLIITSNVDIAVGKLVFDWTAINVIDDVNKNLLQVDVTNPYLLDEVDGVLTLLTNKPNEGEYLTSVKNTIAINEGEAIKINFFKSIISENYTTTKITVVEVDGLYKIVLG